MSGPILFVVASDAGFFDFAQGTIRSLRQTLPAGELAQIAFLDIGCSPVQLKWLRQHVDLLQPALWDFAFPGRERAPEHLKALLARAHLPRYFPGFEVYVWIDADAWVQDGQALVLLLEGARKRGLAVVPELDRGQLSLQYGGLASFQKYYYDVYQRNHGEETARQLHNYPVLNAGVFALHRDAPHWIAWQKVLESALQRPHNIYADQSSLNVVVYQQFFEKTELLPHWCNWTCYSGLPGWDKRRQKLVEPYLPHQPIGIMHLCAKPKPDIVQLRATDGDLVQVSVRYPAQALPLQGAIVPPENSAELARAEHLFRAGKLEDLELLCRSLLEGAPRTTEAHRFLGLTAFARDRLAEAEAHVRRALALEPDSAPAHDNLALYLLRLDRPGEAEAAARRALDLQPTLANAAHNLGLALRRQGRGAEAEAALRQALVLEPHNADVWQNLAAVLEQLRRPTEAIVALELALKNRPDFPLARANLQRLQALPLPGPRGAGLTAADENNRGVALLAEQRNAEAEAAFRQALLLAPEMAEISFNLAKALQAQQRLDQAEEFFVRARDLRPDWADVHFHLGYLYFCQRRLSDAEAEYRRTVELAPAHVDALNSLAANVLNNQGRIDEARHAYQQALALAPNHASCRSNMLLNEQYSPGVTLAGLAELHADWERRHAKFGAHEQAGENERTGEGEKGRRGEGEYSAHADEAASPSPLLPFSPASSRPVRLGFVSGDFFYHPVGVFLAPILERLDRKQWFSVCYANQKKDDELTRRLAQAAGQWRFVQDLSDDALATQIRADGIDLLFDLSGHTGGNRLLTFARKPAPIQLTWMAYVGTTGLAAIDYLVADRFHVPPGWEQHYREKILRLPDGYLCYEPPAYAPAVGPLPALAAGLVTFGCFNNTAKITPAVVAVWAEILRRLPQSRLILKYHWLDDAGLRQRMHKLFEAEAIAAERVELLGSTSHLEQLRQYNRIDLGLDTFPYSGGLTTCEACWMGVPVVTCPGETFASRHSLSHLSNIGLTDTITGSLKEYVDKAVSLANDRSRLSDMRSGLRQQMARAPLCDLDRFTEQFSAACRQVVNRRELTATSSVPNR